MTDVNEIVKEILLTTDDTKEFYIKNTKYDYLIRELVYEELSKPFSYLESKFIEPLLRPDEYTYNFHYNGIEEGIDYEYLNLKNISIEEFQMNATLKWLEEKERDINLIIKNYGKYKTFSLNTSKEKIIKLYKKFKKIHLISPTTKEVDFVNCFTGGNLDYQPKIKFNDSKQTFSFLLIQLMNRNLLKKTTHYNSIMNNSLLFIQRDGSPFSDLKSSFTKYENYTINEYSNSDNIFPIEDILQDLFD